MKVGIDRIEFSTPNRYLDSGGLWRMLAEPTPTSI
jgi:hypothetical protein